MASYHSKTIRQITLEHSQYRDKEREESEIVESKSNPGYGRSRGGVGVRFDHERDVSCEDRTFCDWV